MKNVFTVDLEDWFHANYEDGLFQNNAAVASTVEVNTDIFLRYFRQYHHTATFFVLGFVAEQHPDLIRRIASEGHEIASHGYGHQLVYKQTPEEFRADIKKGKTMLEDIVGEPVIGYRAPSWSITKKSLWALRILQEEGFRYDSSIFPFENFLYGIAGAPRFPYSTKMYNENSDLLEIPPSTIAVPGMNIPFSGGFYFRVMPYIIIKLFTNMINRSGKPAVFYLHPREIDPTQPRLNLSKKDAFIHYYGISRCEKKLKNILQQTNFSSIRRCLYDCKTMRNM